MPTPNILVSVIIVNYHVQNELFACISSLLKTPSNISFEIIVVDNDEEKTLKKSLLKRFPKVKYIASPGNIGFGAGNNIGAAEAQGKFLFFLNPDTKVNTNTLSILVRFLEKHQKTGIIAPLLVDAKNKPFPLQGTGKLTPSTALFAHSFLNKFFPSNPISRKFWLKDWDKQTLQKVDAAPGTGFMIRKTLFENIGKFDEKFFLYFEEDDLGQRVSKADYEICITPETSIFHAIGKSMKKSDKDTSDIFKKSRYYYFRKYYGILLGSSIELFLRLRKSDFLFFGILFFGIFLRFFHKNENFYFDGEIGDNLLAIKNFYLTKTIPLLGPPTSHPWLYFGPLFYWLYGPFLIFSKFNPLSYTYFGTFFSCLVIVANYLTVKKIFNTTAAIISSYLIAISPLFLDFAKNSRFFTLIPFVVYPFLYVLFRISQKQSKAFFTLGFLFGIMLNFHYTPLMLIPFVASIFVIKKVSLNKAELMRVLLGCILPLFPFFLFDGTHGFTMTKNLLLWIPYRMLGFLGVYHKNTLSSAVLHENTLSFGNFFSDSFFHTLYPLTGYAIFIALVFGFFFLVKKIEPKNKYPSVFVFLWGIWGLVAIFVHGNPPSHYFVPILSFPIVVASIVAGTFWNKKLGKVIIVSLLAILTYVNISFFFSKQWFYEYMINSGSFANQKKVAQTIINDAKGKPFMLKRIGYNDQFDKNYAQNFIYLLWLYGNEPKNYAYRLYTIYDTPAKVPPRLGPNETAFIISPSLAIIREDF